MKLTKKKNIKLDLIYSYCKFIESKFPGFIIGGSVSLLLQKAISERIPKDIDIISPSRELIQQVKSVYKTNRHNQFRIDDVKFDMFYNPEAKYIVINEMLISPIDEIVWAKQLKNFNKSIKHKIDIDEINENIIRNPNISW